MKRKTVFPLVLTMLVSLSACGGQSGQEEQSLPDDSSSAVVAEISAAEEDDSKTESSQEQSPESASDKEHNDYSVSPYSKYVNLDRLSDKTKTNVVDIITGNTMTVRAEGKLFIAAGLGADFNVFLSRDGDCMRLELSAAGKKAVILRNDSGTYSLDEDSKTAVLYSDYTEERINPFYSNPATKVMISYLTSMFGMNEINLSGSGQEEYSGASLSYEEYTAGNSVIRLYYDGNTLKNISIQKDGNQTELVVREISSSADSSSFVIPTDYTVK